MPSLARISPELDADDGATTTYADDGDAATADDDDDVVVWVEPTPPRSGCPFRETGCNGPRGLRKRAGYARA